MYAKTGNASWAMTSLAGCHKVHVVYCAITSGAYALRCFSSQTVAAALSAVSELPHSGHMALTQARLWRGAGAQPSFHQDGHTAARRAVVGRLVGRSP